MRNNVSGLPIVAAASLLAALAGCGGATYDALLNAHLSNLRSGAPFRSLWGPTEIPDTPVTIRVPMVFAKSYLPNSPHDDDKGKIKPSRLQPPFLQLPGFRMSYEGTAAGAAGTLPYYCYLAVVPGGDAGEIAAKLQAQLKEKFKETPDQWENVDAKTPEDKAISWRKLRVTADQPFFVNANGQVSEQVMPGDFELWIHEHEGQVVLVGWRAPKEIEGASPPPQETTTSQGLTLLQPPAQGKPDLGSMPALTAGTLVIKPAQ
jgi:hypothetical protein